MTFASIHSDEENGEILAYGARMWIGGLRTGLGGDFYWEDGTDWDYEAWRPSEPNNDDELYVEVNVQFAGSVGWNDFTGTADQQCVFADPVSRLSHNNIPFSFLYFYALYFVEILIIVLLSKSVRKG